MGGSYGLSLIRAILSGSELSRGIHSVAFNGLPIKNNGNEKSKIDRDIRIRYPILVCGEERLITHQTNVLTVECKKSISRKL